MLLLLLVVDTSAQQCGDSVDVLVVGAGMSGLTAIARLQENAPDLTYKLVEMTDRIGGRVSTVEFGGIEVEEGAGWALNVPGSRNDVPELLAEFGISIDDFAFDDISVYKRTAEVRLRSKFHCHEFLKWYNHRVLLR